uniref:Uncharacterized protein n=1 Tax=Anguilla anguilla TaxID=7936 RepID=A0A0E9Q6J2_ANGAN
MTVRSFKQPPVETPSSFSNSHAPQLLNTALRQPAIVRR